MKHVGTEHADFGRRVTWCPVTSSPAFLIEVSCSRRHAPDNFVVVDSGSVLKALTSKRHERTDRGGRISFSRNLSSANTLRTGGDYWVRRM